jgi:hypothetical protein
MLIGFVKILHIIIVVNRIIILTLQIKDAKVEGPKLRSKPLRGQLQECVYY